MGDRHASHVYHTTMVVIELTNGDAIIALDRSCRQAFQYTVCKSTHISTFSLRFTQSNYRVCSNIILSFICWKPTFILIYTWVPIRLYSDRYSNAARAPLCKKQFQNAMETENSEKYLYIYSYYRCLSCSVIELVSGKLCFFFFKPHHCDTDNHFYFYWRRSAHHIYTYIHIHYTCLTRIRVVWWGLPCGGRQHFDRQPKERISVLVYTHWNITATCACVYERLKSFAA